MVAREGLAEALKSYDITEYLKKYDLDGDGLLFGAAEAVPAAIPFGDDRQRTEALLAEMEKVQSEATAELAAQLETLLKPA